MTDVACPIQCVGVGCPQPDFIERNGAWLLTVVGVFTGALGTMLTFFLRSRCTKIRFCGLQCDRELPPVEPEAIEFESSKPKGSSDA